MALLVNEHTIRFQNISSDRPMMLKDFLRDDNNYYQYSSCTSSSSCKSTAFSKSNKPPPAVVLLKSWSKKAAATKISAVHKVINAVKLLHFVKSPLMTILPRSNSRKLGKGKNDISGMSEEGKVKVKVKDILRWRSFRDTVADEDCNRTTTTTTTTTSSCSKRSSWCDSDFTAEEEEEELPFWGGENEEGILGKKCFVGTNAVLLRNTKGDWSVEECEQQSPVSVFDSPFQEVIRESIISPLIHPTAANFEKARCILARRIQELEGTTKSKRTRKYSRGGIDISEGVNAEEKAKQLLSHVEEDIANNNDHIMIYDFFMHELSINGKLHDVGFDDEILRMAKSWIDGEYDESYEWEVENTREAYVKDMEKGVSWNKSKQEQEELSVDLEVMVLNELIDDALVDFLTQ